MAESEILEKPTKEKAKHITEEVEFEDRLDAVKMTSMTGDKKKSIYSLENLVNFLEIKKDFDPFETNIKGGITYVDLNEVVEWIRNTLNDEELAKEINKRLNAEENYLSNLKSIKPLLDKRYNQCKRILANY